MEVEGGGEGSGQGQHFEVVGQGRGYKRFFKKKPKEKKFDGQTDGWKQGRIHGYQSRVRVDRGHIEGHQIIWTGAVRSKK